MGMMLCHSCDTLFDSKDGELGCHHCLDLGRRWCWMCSRGFEPDEHHPDEAKHKKGGHVVSWLEEDEDDPEIQT